MDQSILKAEISSDVKTVELSMENNSKKISHIELQQEDLFECTVCEENFTNENDLTRHYKDHMERNLFMCVSDEECETSFDEPEFSLDWQQHSESKISTTVDQSSFYECDICNKIFSLESSLTKHYSVHTEINLTHEAHVAEQSFSVEQNIKCDLPTSIDKISPYECDICHKIFSQKSSLTRHYSVHAKINIVDSDEEYETQVEKQSFSLEQINKCDLSSSVGQISPYECDICHKRFSQKSSLTRHYSVHGEIFLIESGIAEKRYACSFCGKSFLLEEQLKRHYRCHVKPYKCNVCQKTFPFKSNLITHNHTHLDTNLHVCPICFKSFSYRRDLKYHIMIHKEIEPLSSTIQNNIQPFYSLVQNYNSNDIQPNETIQTYHLKDKSDSDFNSNDKLFNCNRCDKSFNSNNKLSIHYVKHTNVKRHTCIVCLKSFSKISHLQCHLRIHTGEKPFSCNVCERAFSEKGNLVKHQLRHERDSLRKDTSVLTD